MKRSPFYVPPDPKYRNSFLDSCAFDTKYAPEDAYAAEIRELRNIGEIHLLLAHSNQKEIDHPKTPADVKAEAADMIYTNETDLTDGERVTRQKVHDILTGNGRPEKYEADARHVFEAGKYGGAYFITADRRILSHADELETVCGAIVVTPSRWLEIYRSARSEEPA
ncbi:hypothetical protein HDG34_007898 [Paraburkholderia sp. HC6.4b]|uniref:hypothetical protein n=1 Tax=unclassified Paraburkholderia TaxID=2615204 RepID=UPI001610309C|nr:MULTISPECIES: hypothetical protein [unclassified Paraburkholderia]MBB5413915.1 hypothetical protein [Paraburkholderia sp. HC6.4b]MBB5453229.1 hypothetical protein [Paraburkholderia sp. Kb1A]